MSEAEHPRQSEADAVNATIPPSAPRVRVEHLDMPEYPFEYIFAPLEEFEWKHDGRLIGAYHVGNTYNVSKHPMDTMLRKVARAWHAAGKIEIFPLTFGQRFVTTTPAEGIAKSLDAAISSKEG